MSQARKLMLVLLVGLAAYGVQAALRAQEEKNKERGQAAAAKQDQKDAKMGMMCPMMHAMKGIRLHADSPALLLGRQDALKLSDQQVEKLKDIAESTRRDARQVLTEDQRQELAEAPQGPLSMMDVCQLRMQEMKGKDQESGAMCPMCMKMMKERMASKNKAPERD